MVHWLNLKELNREEDMGPYTELITLQCPECDGVIKRHKDHTPGFKDSYLEPCDKCGFEASEIEPMKEGKKDGREKGKGKDRG